MSSVTFDASLNTDKLEKGIKQSNKTVKDWAKDVETSSKKADRSFKNLGSSLKSTINEQKGYVKGLTTEIVAMQKAFDKATGGSKKSQMGRELGQAKRRLKEATGELIGMQEEQIAVNNKEIESTKGLTSQIKDWVLKLGGVALAYKLVKDAIGKLTVAINTFNIAGAVMQQVMYNIVTGAQSWTAGIQNAIQAQKRLNELRFEEKIYAKAALKETIEYDKALSAAHDQLLTATERVEAYDSALIHLENVNKLRKKSIQDEIDALADSRKFQQGDEKTVMKIADLKLKLLQLDHRLWAGQREMVSMRSGIVKTEERNAKKALDDKKKAATEAAKIENKIKKEQGLLAKSVEDGNEVEMKAIALRLVELQKELVLRKKIAAAAIGAAIGRETGPTKITGLTGPIFGKLKTSEGLAPSPDVAASKEWIAQQKEWDETKLENQKNLVKNAILFTDQLVEQLDLTQEQAEAIGLLSGVAEQLIEGNYAGAALSILAKVIGVFGQMKDVMSEPAWKKQIAAWDALIERQLRVIQLAERTGGSELALQKVLDDAQKKLDDINTEVTLARERRGVPTQEMLAAQMQARDDLVDAQQALRDFYTGGITEIDIAGTIAQGFNDAEGSLISFADKFDNLMRNAINSSLEELSKPEVAAWYKQFAAYMESGGGLDEEEKKLLKIQWDNLIANAKQRRDEAFDIAGIDETTSTNQGLTGAIRRDITEETGTELAGLFRRFADDQRVAKDYSILGVNHLVGIEKNTYDTVIRLDSAIVELQSIVSNTKQVPVGDL